jgi:hypothetical protein
MAWAQSPSAEEPDQAPSDEPVAADEAPAADPAKPASAEGPPDTETDESSAGEATEQASPPVGVGEPSKPNEAAKAPALAKDAEPAENPLPPGEPIDRDEKRPVPDYDGRDEPVTPGDVLIWIPRVGLFPLYVVSEYLVRRPLGWLATTAEREHWPTLLVDFFTFGPDRRGGIVPTAMFDFGLRPSAGLYFFLNEVGFEENDIRARAAYGGEHFWLFRVADRISFGEETSLALSGGYESRPDQPYHGIGGRERQSPQPAAFYQRELSDGRLELSSRWFRSSKFSAAVGVASMKTNGNVSCCGEPTIAERLVRAPQVAVPQGLGQRYTTMFAEGDVSFDTRLPRLPDTEPAQDTPPVSGSGFRLDLRGRYSYQLDRGTLSDPDADTHQRWVTYGSTLSGFVDVSSERVVGLSVITDFVDPLGIAETGVDLISVGALTHSPRNLDSSLEWKD